MTKHIVILGASFAGIVAAHTILKSLPDDCKVLLVSPSTHVYWNIAAPRLVTAPGLLKDEQVFIPFAQFFASYPESKYEFIQGKAVALKPESNAVIIKTIDDSHPEGLSEQEIVYEHIVVATGSHSHQDWPFKSEAPYTKTLEDIKNAQDAIANAGKIVISGAGPTGRCSNEPDAVRND
jgi:NADH dehydrogenase FAD-containing subunit